MAFHCDITVLSTYFGHSNHLVTCSRPPLQRQVLPPRMAPAFLRPCKQTYSRGSNFSTTNNNNINTTRPLGGGDVLYWNPHTATCWRRVDLPARTQCGTNLTDAISLDAPTMDDSLDVSAFEVDASSDFEPAPKAVSIVTFSAFVAVTLTMR